MANNDYILRLETEKDYYEVESLAREAFWNLSFPGCSEHLFMHVLRQHPSFIPQLDFVAECDGKIIGSVMYSESYLEDEKGEKKTVLTMGPICVFAPTDVTPVVARSIQVQASITESAPMRTCPTWGIFT